MADCLRESIAGHALRRLFNNKILQYPEERPDLQSDGLQFFNADGIRLDPSNEKPGLSKPLPATNGDIRTLGTQKEAPQDNRVVITVGWYSINDSANPQNWSTLKKCMILLQLCLYTFAVYVGSAIITPAEVLLQEQFMVSQQASLLVLSLYVFGYGVGPLIFSPLSEIPSLGRNKLYIITFAIFVILCIPTALVKNFAGLVVLRFLQGFIGSPVLATGGATLGDMFSMITIPYPMAFWVSAAYCGPAFGPLLSAFAVDAETWRWAIWEMMWISGPIFLLMLFLMPETNPDTLLLQRAQRLRKATGNPAFQSLSEIKQRDLHFTHILIESLQAPFLITILDPAMLFSNVYTALNYGIYYSFFDVFPIVYLGIYHYSTGTMSVIFLAIIIACILAIISYCSYLYFYLVPWTRMNGLGIPEKRLVAALFAATLPPIGLFLFGWTARKSISWVVPTIGIVLFGSSSFVVAQCIFVYIPMSYPRHAASLFASNDFMRSAVAAGAIHFAEPLYSNLGVGKGCSVLGALMVACLIGIWLLWYFGAALRKRSQFAAKW